MNTKVNMDLNLRGVQEQAGDAVKQVRTYSRRFFLVSVGMVGLTYDTGMSLWDDGMKLFDKAEGRGEELEQKFFDEMGKLRDQTTDEAKKLKGRVEEQVNSVAKEVSDGSRSVEQEVEKILARVGFGSKPSFVEEAGDIEIERVEEMMTAPFEGYDDLVAADVIERVKAVDSKDALYTLRSYESDHKNRVTVLREIEQRMEELTAPQPA